MAQIPYPRNTAYRQLAAVSEASEAPAAQAAVAVVVSGEVTEAADTQAVTAEAVHPRPTDLPVWAEARQEHPVADSARPELVDSVAPRHPSTDHRDLSSAALAVMEAVTEEVMAEAEMEAATQVVTQLPPSHVVHYIALKF